MTTPLDLYRACRVSGERLETLQDYVVPGDEERQRAFHDGRPLPPPRPAKAADLALIRELRRAGRQVGRVHVVDRPLSAYIRYELAVYAENTAAGEYVRIADRAADRRLAALAQDFVIFDAGTSRAVVLLFGYDAAGANHGFRVANDRRTVDRCREQYAAAFAASVPLAEFTAASPAA